MSVYIGKVGNYDLKDIESSIRESLSTLKINLEDKKTAFLKPNIVIPAKPDSAIITHPSVVEALVNVLRERGLKDIIIGEGVGVGQNSEEAFQVSGYKKLAEKMNLKLVDLDNEERVNIEWKHGAIGIPKVVLDCDIYVNLPKIKTHGQTTVTLSMKNQKGLLLPSDKRKFHKEFGLHEPLVDLTRIISPDIVVVDGIQGMEGEGPLRGKKRDIGVIVIGSNMVEVDSVCSGIIGIEPVEVVHLKKAANAGLGSLDPEVKGTPLEQVRTKFEEANEEYGHVLKIYSWRNPYACSMCIHSFSDAIKLATRRPEYWLTVVPKLAYYGLLKSLHIVQGKNAEIPTKSGRIICIGDCTKELSDKQNLSWVKGCPPKPEDILKEL